MTLGADSLVPVTQDLVDSVQQRFGAMPAFWGRYFKKPGFPQDYQPAAENPVLHANNLQLLPVARQTANVGGTAVTGATDAINNVDAFTQSLGVEFLAGIGGELLMFLDVEGTSAANPNLSADYWIGWSTALVNHSRAVSGNQFTIVPGVYCRQNQNPTWNAIASAAALGYPCTGAWVFRMRNGACDAPIPNWDAPFDTPAVPLPCPILLWQFAIDCLTADGIDFDMVNPDPAAETALLDRLILPPG
jgi:hypothetical protein